MDTASLPSFIGAVRVLLVDDQRVIVEAVRRMLVGEPDLEFASECDPTLAVAAAERVRPTVILQDLVMPGMDGLSLLHRYRQSPSLRHVPVIVLSSNEDPAIKKASFEAGANDYLVKLPDRVELLARARMHSLAFAQRRELHRAMQALEEGQRVLSEKNAELARLNERLAEATRVKSEFLANMSHEIRTPLVGVLGMAELLGGSGLAPHQREFVDVIRGSGETLLRILNDILDLAKTESGRLELEDLEYDARAVVDETLELVAPPAFGKGVEISGSVDPSVPLRLRGDATRFRQVLLNLLNNAVKFTSEGEVCLSLRLHPQKPGTLLGCVEDTGIGIPAAKLAGLFQDFSQVDASITRRFGGTGLGLAICRNLLALMGGRIWAENRVGDGTRFLFEMPLRPVEVQPEGRPRSQRGWALFRNERLRDAVALYGQDLGLSVETIDAWPTAPLPADVLLFVDYDAFAGVVGPLRDFGRVILFTRSRDLAAIRAAYPEAIVLTLPVKRRHLRDLLTAPSPVKDPAGPVESAPRLAHRVLVADDNPVNRRVSAAQLHKLGVATVSEAADGTEAVRLAREERFDLVLMDVGMPTMDGFEAARRMRQDVPEGRQPRIVALTANALPELREVCLAAGMDDFLVKPVRLETMRRTLEACTLAAAGSPANLAAPEVSVAKAEVSVATAAVPVRDDAQFRELRTVVGSDEAVAELVELFQAQLQALSEALPALADDARRLGAAAHKLRGGAAYVGAVGLVEACARVERLVAEGSWRPTDPSLRLLQAALTAAAGAYRPEAAGGK